MKLWLFHFSVTHRDQILAEIDETLHKIGVEEKETTTGVQILVDRFRKADAYARGAERRIYELEQSVAEYERVFMAMKAAAVKADPLPPVDDQPTLIEIAARNSSGIDLPHTQKNPVYRPQDDRAREMPVMDSRRGAADPQGGAVDPQGGVADRTRRETIFRPEVTRRSTPAEPDKGQPSG